MFYLRITTKNETADSVYKFLIWYKENEGNLVRGSFYPRMKNSEKRGIVAFNEICRKSDVDFQNGRKCLNFIKNKFDVVNEQIVVEKEDYYKILTEEFNELVFKVDTQPVSVPIPELEFDKLGHIKSMLTEECLDITESLCLVRWLLDDIEQLTLESKTE